MPKCSFVFLCFALFASYGKAETATANRIFHFANDPTKKIQVIYGSRVTEFGPDSLYLINTPDSDQS